MGRKVEVRGARKVRYGAPGGGTGRKVEVRGAKQVPGRSLALDKYARSAGLKSRSAAIQQAIRLLGDAELEDAYAAAWQEWEASGDAHDWESTVADGLADAPR